MTQDTDHLGRPIVVVTGMGVLTSLGQGQADNWTALTGGVSGIHRISRFPIDGLRTTIAGTVDFVPVPEPSAPALLAASGRTGDRRSDRRSRHRPRRRLPRSAVPGTAAGRDGVDRSVSPWPPRPARTTTVTYDDLLRVAGNGSFEPYYRALPVRFGRRSIWPSGSAPRARRWRPRRPAPPAGRRSSSASRRSAAARPRPRWWSAPMPRSTRRA